MVIGVFVRQINVLLFAYNILYIKLNELNYFYSSMYCRGIYMKLQIAKKWKYLIFLAVFVGVIIGLNGYTFLGISQWGTIIAAIFSLLIVLSYIAILFSKKNFITNIVAKFLEIF